MFGSIVGIVVVIGAALLLLSLTGARRIVFTYVSVVARFALAIILRIVDYIDDNIGAVPPAIVMILQNLVNFFQGGLQTVNRGIQLSVVVVILSIIAMIAAIMAGYTPLVIAIAMAYAVIGFLCFSAAKALGGLVPNSDNWGYSFGVFSMSMVLIAMIALGLPGVASSPFLALLWMLGFVGFLYGAVLNSTAKWAPHVLFASAILVVLATGWTMWLPEGTQSQRYLVSVLQKWDTQAGRNAAANELDVHFTEATILAYTPVYTGSLDDKGNITTIDYAKDSKGNTKTLNAGTKVMVNKASVPVFASEGREPLIQIKEADEFGQFVMVKESYFVPKRFTSESTADPVGLPEVIQAKHTDSGSGVATTRPIAVGETVKVTVPANVEWFNTGIDTTNRKVAIKVISGEWKNHPNSGTNAGEGRSPYKDQKQLVVPSAPLSSLVARTDSNSFLVGNSFEGKTGNGALRLAINDKGGYYQDNSGSLEVEITALQ